jgi:hypothetical protein
MFLLHFLFLLVVFIQKSAAGLPFLLHPSMSPSSSPPTPPATYNQLVTVPGQRTTTERAMNSVNGFGLLLSLDEQLACSRHPVMTAYLP